MPNLLFNPNTYQPTHLDPRSRELLRSLIDWNESRGKAQLKDDYHAARWYADFQRFVADSGLFAHFATPAEVGELITPAQVDAKWDTARINELNEILGFYSLDHWYAWQVTVLGLGPVWTSANDQAKRLVGELLRDGGFFGFGLSEQGHGADIYATDLILRSDGADGWLAAGPKYYIGNGNVAARLSVFGRFADDDPQRPGEYAFFLVDTQHSAYRLQKNVVHGSMYVAAFTLDDYPVAPADLLHTGRAAWDAALATVNVGKVNLGWASIGICEHAFYEAITHAHGRILYGRRVTDFPHVAQMLTDAYARLLAMKLFGDRAIDYFRSANAEDRRYLLYNPITKMKVTTEGERVIDLLWDVIAARGFEKDTYFEMATRDIRSLPKLEGTVHVNMALVLKFMVNYLFNPAGYEAVPARRDAVDDDLLFHQGPTRGLGKVRFHDWRAAYAAFAHVPNVARFFEQAEGLPALLQAAPPSEDQQRDLDFMLTLGELFTLVVYGQLILEQAEMAGLDADVIDQVFDVFVRDFSAYAVELHGKASSTEAQQAWALGHVRKPVTDEQRFGRVWAQVQALAGAYEMRP